MLKMSTTKGVVCLGCGLLVGSLCADLNSKSKEILIENANIRFYFFNIALILPPESIRSMVLLTADSSA